MRAPVVNCQPQAEPLNPPSFKSVMLLHARSADPRAACGMLPLQAERPSMPAPAAPMPLRKSRREPVPRTDESCVTLGTLTRGPLTFLLPGAGKPGYSVTDANTFMTAR